MLLTSATLVFVILQEKFTWVHSYNKQVTVFYFPANVQSQFAFSSREWAEQSRAELSRAAAAAAAAAAARGFYLVLGLESPCLLLLLHLLTPGVVWGGLLPRQNRNFLRRCFCPNYKHLMQEYVIICNYSQKFAIIN